MTIEQVKREIDSLDYYLQNHTDDYGEESHTAMMMAIKALEFTEFVAMEVLGKETWEYNKYAFPKIACRKLEKIGLVKADGDMWCLAESEE